VVLLPPTTTCPRAKHSGPAHVAALPPRCP
jgi:hypothetical protein